MKRTIIFICIVLTVMFNVNLLHCQASDWDYVIGDTEKDVHIDIDSIKSVDYVDSGKNMVFWYKVRVKKKSEYLFHAACKLDVNGEKLINVFEYDIYDLKGKHLKHEGTPEPLPDKYERIINESYGYYLFIRASYYLEKHGSQ